MQTTNQGFMDNDWFEMNDLKKRDYNRSVWIPLCRSEILKKEKRYGTDGHIEEYTGCFAVMFDAYLEAIRSEFLKDYLMARKAGLLVSTFQSRTSTTADSSQVPWNQSDLVEETDNSRWIGYIREMHEGGIPFGEKAAVIQIRRDDVPYQDDVPEFPGAPDEDFTVDRWESSSSESKIYAVSGEIWKNEWITPADISPRVKGDYVPSVIPFIISADGQSLSGEDDLKKGLRWHGLGLLSSSRCEIDEADIFPGLLKRPDAWAL